MIGKSKRMFGKGKECMASVKNDWQEKKRMLGWVNNAWKGCGIFSKDK